MAAKLTVASARDLEFEDLLAACEALLEPYEAPHGQAETPQQEFERLSRTLDEMPDIYGWFLTLQSYFDYWTDRAAAAEGTGQKALDYKSMRQRRDLMERMASATKRRYEGASRMVTLRENFEPSGMPRARGGSGL